MSSSVIRIATRSSKLALWQAEHMKSLIQGSSPDIDVEIVHIKTVGDQNQTDALRQFGGTGVFTREVQNSVLAGDTDIAVHSLKDLPTETADGLILAGIPKRAPRFDAILLPNAASLDSLEDLPKSARIGTGSPRRQAQLLSVRPDLQMKEIRGNVDTRIRKLDEGEFDAIILAEAGLRRLSLENRISLVLGPPLVFPAVGQGALGIECRTDDDATIAVLSKLSDATVRQCVTAERSLLAALRAGCHAPLGALAETIDGKLKLTGVLLDTDGKERLQAAETGELDDGLAIGARVARSLLEQGGDKLVATFS